MGAMLNKRKFKKLRKPNSERSIIVYVRLPESMVDALDIIGADESERFPGLTLTRSDVIRMLITRGMGSPKP